MSFPKNFAWGAGAASYQVEGAFNEDGRGVCTWDAICRRPGAIVNNDNAEIACDHYHRYKEDVALMKKIGLRAYRMSVSWPRVLPEGTGKVNAKGLAFYDKLIDELVGAGIQPWITLFHWDYPQALQDRGGWLNPSSSDWFAEYAGVLADKLSDRVEYWITYNEPQVVYCAGHMNGMHAPGLKLPLRDVLQVSHNMLLGHGKAVQALRARGECQVGMAPGTHTTVPVTDSPRDIEAARQAVYSMREGPSSPSWWLETIFKGSFPADGVKMFGPDMPKVTDSDLKTICQPLDFFGMNLYHGTLIRAGADGRPEHVPFPPGYDQTARRWPFLPEAIYWGTKLHWERFGKPIVITENGMAGHDWIFMDGKVHDPQRIDCVRRNLLNFERAIDEGVQAKAYFHWCATDNFDWLKGYRERFGLVFVDFTTQKRILKDSAYWYAKVIKTNGASLHEDPFACSC